MKRWTRRAAQSLRNWWRPGKKRVIFWSAKIITGGETTSDWVVRLFPNRADYRYRGRVHETIDASILASGARLQQTQIRIDHDFSSDHEARRRRTSGTYKF